MRVVVPVIPSSWSSYQFPTRIVDGAVVCVPKRKRVAILGFGSSSRHLAPWSDTGCEIWTLNNSFRVAERPPDRTFEIHRPESREDAADPDYFDDLRLIGCPIYMIEPDPAFPMSVKYPLDDVRASVPSLYRNYFTCCVAYMIALAIHEGFEFIGLYGVDSTIGTEYEQQKPCIEAWLSLGIGRGIEAEVPTTSALFKTPYLYGYQAPKQWPRVLQASEKFLEERIAEHQQRAQECRETQCRHEGAFMELAELLKFAVSSSRGSQFPILGGLQAEKDHAAGKVAL